MATPVLALLWEWWRTTRRQILFCAAIGTLAGWALLARAADEGAFPVFLLLVSVAVLAWFATLARSGRAGFPQPLAFVRPVRTWVLVAVAMFYLAGACAATYVIPTVVLRAAFGAPLPLLPVAVLIGAGAALFCASNWFTRARAPRLVASVVFVLAIGPALRWLAPWKAPPNPMGPPVLTVAGIQLGLVEYAAVAIAVAVAFAATVLGVDGQRHDGGAVRPLHGPAAEGARASPKGLVEQFRDAVLGLVRVPCPTSSPLAAELWLETKARGLPVVVIGAVLAACIPLLLSGNEPALWGIGLTFAGVAVTLPFFAGISVSFWHRDSSLRAPMNVFEAVRPATTTRLAAVQIAVAVTSILAAWLLLGASLWLSLPHFRAVDSAPLQRALVAALAAWPAVRLALTPIVTVVAFATVVALLAAVRAYSVRHGKWVWLGALGVAAYVIGLSVAAGSASENLSAAVIGVHVWALALAIPLLTGLVIVRALAHGLLSFAVCAGMVAAWVAFAAAAAYLAYDFGFAVTALPSALAALAAASLVLPLTAAVLAPWSLRSIRHV
jgi:hypothetical protein